MAKNKIRASTDRINLGENIPLATPVRVNIGVSTLCNFHCFFCYHNKETWKGDGKIMSLEVAQRCIDDLKEFPQKVKMLSFFSHGEPLLNKNLPDIVSYAKRSEVAECLEITTNGALLTRDLTDQLFNGGGGGGAEQNFN
jgi:MoaA/NifB/PqqE/SkfB family radical SAM enzyme